MRDIEEQAAKAEVRFAVRTAEITLSAIEKGLRKAMSLLFKKKGKVSINTLTRNGEQLEKVIITGELKDIKKLAKKYGIQLSAFKDGKDYLCFFKARNAAEMDALITALAKKQLEKGKDKEITKQREPIQVKIQRYQEKQQKVEKQRQAEKEKAQPEKKTRGKVKERSEPIK